MADVWLVRHTRLGSVFALKCLQRHQPEQLARFILEGRAQGQMRHPGLLPVHEILTVGDRPALLMPYIDGPALSQLLNTYPPSQEEAVALFAALLGGLGEAHRLGYVHRDLKPANILLELRPGRIQPRIADFGLVKRVGIDRTVTGAVFGTPAYAAPEQLYDASTTTYAADVFSLGVIFAEMLNGYRPFSGTGLVQIYDAQHKPPALGTLSGPLRELLEEMLRTEPAHRPASCAAIAERLGTVSMDPLATGGPVWEAADALRRSRQTKPSLDADGLYSALNAVTTFTQSPHNLRQDRDHFVGRRTDIARILQTVRSGCRLVSITGFGGVGKTRLAREAAWTMVNDDWPGGIWFVSLAEVRSHNALLAAVAAELDVQLGVTPDEQLVHVLARRGRILLLLDNFEHILAFGEDTVGRWLDQAPDLTVVTTSREPLWLRGEQIISLEPLSEGDGVALFEARAKAVSPFALTDANRDAVAALVRQLDGLPLAIELAAARSRLHSVATLRERLQRRFDLLRSRSQTLPPRQRTLRATLRWSWDLLNPWEQDALAQAAVFEGGATIAALEAVVELPQAEAQGLWVEDIFTELLDKSLLQANGTGRLWMLVSVQQFALEHLADRTAAERRHGAYFAEWGTRAALGALDRHGGNDRLKQMHLDLENLCTAAERAVARGDGEIAANTTLAAGAVLKMHGPLQRYRDLLESALSLVGPWQPQLHAEAGYTYRQLGDLEQAVQRIDRALIEARAAGEPETVCTALVLRAGIPGRGAAAERASVLEGLAIARDLRDRSLEVRALLALIVVLTSLNEVDEAVQIGQTSLKICRKIGFRLGEGDTQLFMSLPYKLLGQHEQQLLCYQAAKECYAAIGFKAGILQVSTLLLRVIKAKELPEHADARFSEALQNARALGDRIVEVDVLLAWTIFLARNGSLDRAAQMARQTIDVAQAAGVLGSLASATYRLGHIEEKRGRFDEAFNLYQSAIDTARSYGRADIIAMTLRALGLFYTNRGALQEGRATLSESLQVTRQHHLNRTTIDLLCQLARLELLDGNPSAAQDFLSEVQTTVAANPHHMGTTTARLFAQLTEDTDNREDNAP